MAIGLATLGAVGSIASIAGILIAEWRHANAEAADRAAAFESLKSFLDTLAAGRSSVMSMPLDQTWGRYRYIIVENQDEMNYVDLHPGTHTIRVSQWKRDSATRSMRRVSAFEEISAENFRELLKIQPNSVQFANLTRSTVRTLGGAPA
jgi:hypothetical protein